jgi:PKD repeat protein
VKATNTAGTNPFASQVTVSAEGQHTVEYRSVDKAGNAEATKSVQFGIDIPEPGNPVIEAFADPATGAAPLETRFSASGYDPDGGELTYKWEFADGSFIGRGVTRTFTKPGTYIGKVTATDDEGDKTVKEVTVTVTAPGVQPPTVEAGASVTSGPARLTVAFNATGNDPDGPESQLTYKWEFGDGAVQFLQNPTHTYGTKGTYTAKVTVEDGSGATATKTITITVTDPAGNQAPTIEFMDPLPQGDRTVQFTAWATDPEDEAITYEWDFADGSPKATGDDVTHTFASVGTYAVKLTVTDPHGAKAELTKQVTITATANQAPTVDIAADPASGTAPLPVQFTSKVSDPESQGVSYLWTFGDGGFSAEKAPVHIYTAPGTYTASLKVTDEKGASTTKTVAITVTAAQAAPQAAPKTPDVNAAAAPAVNPWFGVAKPAKTTLATFSKSGLAVRVTATEAMTGTATLTVSKKVAKQLGLKKTTLASGKVTFTGAGAKSVTLKPSAAVKRAPKKAKGSVKVTLGVSLRATGKSAKQSTRTITLAIR